MPVKDTFSYTAKWESAGIDCSSCKFFAGPAEWPDKNNKSKCTKHNIPLVIELGEDKYKEGEWFCRDYSDKDGFSNAVEHFHRIKHQLQPRTLYRCNQGEYLIEYNFDDIQKDDHNKGNSADG